MPQRPTEIRRVCLCLVESLSPDCPLHVPKIPFNFIHTKIIQYAWVLHEHHLIWVCLNHGLGSFSVLRYLKMEVGGYPLFSNTSALNWAWHIEHVLAIAWQRLSRQSSFQGIHWQPHGAGQAVSAICRGWIVQFICWQIHTSLIAVIRVLSSASCGVNLTLCSRLKNWGCITFAEQLKYEAAWRQWQQCLRAAGSIERGCGSKAWSRSCGIFASGTHTYTLTWGSRPTCPWVSTGLQCFLKYAF